MAFQKPLPEWKKQGIRPPESKITEGYNVMDKPPAAWMNWHMNTTYEALEELQNNAAEKTDVTSALSEAKSYTDLKVADIDLSKITPEFIGAETPAGAQAKADEAGAKSVPKNGNADKNGTLQIFSDADTLNLFGTTHTYMTFQPNGHAGGRTGYIGASNPANPKNMIIASDKGNIDLYGTHITHNGRNVLGEIDSLKTSGVDAKNKIAGAINAKGVPASANDTFDQLAGKIGQISTGGRIDVSGRADGNDVLVCTLPALTKNASFADTGRRSSRMVRNSHSGGHAALLVTDDKGFPLRILYGPEDCSYEINRIDFDLKNRKIRVAYTDHNSSDGYIYDREGFVDIQKEFNVSGHINLISQTSRYGSAQAYIDMVGSVFLY